MINFSFSLHRNINKNIDLQNGLINGYKIFSAIKLFLLLLIISPILNSKEKFDDIKNRGNSYFIDNHFNFSFSLRDLPKDFILNASNKNNERTAKFIVNFFLDEKISKTNNTSLFKVEMNNTFESWYEYSYDTKFWDYNLSSNVLTIILKTDFNCHSESLFKNYQSDQEEKTTLQKQDKKYIIYSIKCNPELNSDLIRSLDSEFYLFDIILNENECHKTIKFESKFACPRNASLNIYRYFTKYSYIFGLYLIVVGFMILSYGNVFKLVTFYIYSIYFSGMIIKYFEDFILKRFTGVNTDFTEFEYILWITEFSSIIIGILIGHFIKKLKKSKIIFLGAMTGHINIYMIWLSICYYITFQPFIFYFVSNIIAFFLTGYLAYKFFKKSDKFLIYSCAVIGSYTTVKVNLLFLKKIKIIRGFHFLLEDYLLINSF